MPPPKTQIIYNSNHYNKLKPLSNIDKKISIQCKQSQHFDLKFDSINLKNLFYY